jgi:hypothetical protein
MVLMKNGYSPVPVKNDTKKMLDRLPVSKDTTYDQRVLKLINFFLENGGALIE